MPEEVTPQTMEASPLAVVRCFLDVLDELLSEPFTMTPDTNECLTNWVRDVRAALDA